MKQTDTVKKKKKTDPNKPFVHMKPEEAQQAWDEIGADLRLGMLKDARNGKAMKLRFACIFLVTKDDRRLLSYVPEYGDREGLGQEEDFAEEIRRTGSLQPGETLEVQLLEVPFEHALPVGD